MDNVIHILPIIWNINYIYIYISEFVIRRKLKFSKRCNYSSLIFEGDLNLVHIFSLTFNSKSFRLLGNYLESYRNAVAHFEFEKTRIYLNFSIWKPMNNACCFFNQLIIILVLQSIA